MLSHLVVFSVWILGYGAADVINIGVIPSWREILANASHRFPDGHSKRLHDIFLDHSGNTFTRMGEAHQRIQTLNISAIIGPYDNGVALAAEELQVPYLTTTRITKEASVYTLQLIPELKDFCQAFLEFVEVHRWKKISVFYDSDKGLALLERLMTNHVLSVKAWRLPAVDNRSKFSPNDRHAIMKSKAREALVQMRKAGLKHSIVFCEKLYTEFILFEARNLAMLSTPPYEWAFFDPGDEMRDLFALYDEISINFTILTLLEYNSSISSNTSTGYDMNNKFNFALAHDALKLLSSSADNGNILTDLKQSQEIGYTGPLQIDAQGKRSNFTIHLTGTTGPKTYPVGDWFKGDIPLDVPRVNFSKYPDRNLVLYDCNGCKNRPHVFPLRNRTVRVVMIKENPFTMEKRDAVARQGNDRYKGFAVDLLEEMAKKLEFKYEIYLVPDGNFGTKNKDGEWNGMIKELLDGEATMSVAPLSINSEREEAVDFTKPFMTRYISVLLKIPQRKVSYFEFLNPLSRTVWGCTLAAFLVVSFVLYTLERVGSSKSRTNPQISVRESFWFIFGSLLQGNTDACPITIPGRILTSSWWFFALILISSYTANLAAFLTVKKINTPIKTVTDLAQQTKIKYGTVQNSGVMSFFANTNIEHFSKMWAQMSEIEPDSMVADSSAGYDKVKEGNYAFFWDTTVNRYKTITDCDVMEIDPPFDPKGFGVGVPPGATYLEDLSMTILKLSDSGKLHELENKWWGSRNCPDLGKSSSDETSELQIENVAGVFIILVGGIVTAALACLAEYSGNCLLKARKANKKSKTNYTVPSKEKASFL